MKYLISTVQYSSLVNHNLLKNMLLFADTHDVSKIYLYVMPGKHKDETILPGIGDDPRIEFLFLGKEGMKLNSNLKLHDTAILASQINPLTGFQMKLHRDFSYILPSPKIRYLSIPNTSVHPRFLATTGALTHGNYKMHTAQGRKASLEHQYGFSYVKVKNNRVFYFHPVEAMKNGNFNYARELYKGGKVLDQQPEALVLGDWHCGDTCPKTRKRTLIMIEQLKPKRVVFHDLFNGHSINHHERKSNFARARAWRGQSHILEQEVEECLAELNYFAERYPDIEFLVAESNHDIFLYRYLDEESFMQDGQNMEFASVLFGAILDKSGQPSLQTAMELVGDVATNVTFLKEDDELRVNGVCLSQHGHRGVNGARGSGQSFSNYNLKLITGHEHSPKMYANGMVVGTSTHLKLNYTKGPSSWLNAHGLLYKSGKYTLLTIIH